ATSGACRPRSAHPTLRGDRFCRRVRCHLRSRCHYEAGRADYDQRRRREGMNKIAIALTVSSALALAACSKKAPEELPPPPVQTTTPTPTAPPPPAGAAPGTQQHFAQVMQGRDTIFFDTDKYDIDAEDQAALNQQANYLQQYPQVRATVEGHADERGTREYRSEERRVGNE